MYPDPQRARWAKKLNQQHACFTTPLADSAVDCSKARCLFNGEATLVFHWLELAHGLGGVEGGVSRMPWGGRSDFSPAELGGLVLG